MKEDFKMYQFNAKEMKDKCVAWIQEFFEKNPDGYHFYDGTYERQNYGRN